MICPMIRILFICYAYTCRSLMDEPIMKNLVKKAGLSSQYEIVSVATSTEEIGNPVYTPACQKLKEYGISCSGKTAWKLQNKDYDCYNLFVGMERANLRRIYQIGGGDFSDKVHLLLDYTNHLGDIADPWHTEDFDTAWKDIEEGCRVSQ